MDIDKFATLNKIGTKVDGLNPSTPSSIQPRDIGKGPSFEETLRKIGDKAQALQPQGTAGAQELVFSKHAVERMRSRGIGMDPGRMERLETAFGKADAKGSKNTLVLMDDSAYIMSVKNKTIVTAMDKATLKENLFTNIDSTIIV